MAPSRNKMRRHPASQTSRDRVQKGMWPRRMRVCGGGFFANVNETHACKPQHFLLDTVLERVGNSVLLDGWHRVLCVPCVCVFCLAQRPGSFVKALRPKGNNKYKPNGNMTQAATDTLSSHLFLLLQYSKSSTAIYQR